MLIEETKLKGSFMIKPKVFVDNRGWFTENFNKKVFNEAIGQHVNFVQDNESKSTKGVLRGLHYQTGEYAQAKLVRVIQGEVLDVIVDLRKDSASFGEYFKIILSQDNRCQLFVPKGFAHGFVVLSETAIFSYKCDNYYNKEFESGIKYNDPKLNINWQLPEKELIISDKDQILPNLEQLKL